MKFLLNLATLVLIVLTVVFVVIPFFNIFDGVYEDTGLAGMLNILAAAVLSVPWGIVITAKKAYKIRNSFRRR
jgi:membrane protein CcdC involved in cytochrome C biogenesis